MNLDDFTKLPLMLQWATMIGTVIVISYLGITRLRKGSETPPQSEKREIDPIQYTLTTLERIERDMHGRFDRIDRGLVDINRDTIEIRRAKS